VIFVDTFIFNLAHAEQGELTQEVTTMEATREEIVGVAEQEALVGGARQSRRDLMFHRRGEYLIGI